MDDKERERFSKLFIKAIDAASDTESVIDTKYHADVLEAVMFFFEDCAYATRHIDAAQKLVDFVVRTISPSAHEYVESTG